MSKNPDNPITGEPLTDWQVERLDQLAVIKTNARKGARSGNPAIHAPARRVLAAIGRVKRMTYFQKGAPTSG